MILLQRFNQTFIDYPTILPCQRNGKIDCATGGVLRHELCHLSMITGCESYTDVAFVNYWRCIVDCPQCTLDCSHRMLLSTGGSKSGNGNGNYF